MVAAAAVPAAGCDSTCEGSPVNPDPAVKEVEGKGGAPATAAVLLVAVAAAMAVLRRVLRVTRPKIRKINYRYRNLNSKQN